MKVRSQSSDKVKVLVIAGALAIALTAVVTTPASGASGTYSLQQDAAVRIGPAVGYTAMRNLPAGTSVQIDCYEPGSLVLGDSTWAHLQDGSGYVAAAYLDTGGLTLAQLGFTKCGSGGSGGSASGYTYRMKDTVQIRVGPGTGYTTNGIVDRGSLQVFDCYVIGLSVGGDTGWGHLKSGDGYLPGYYIDSGANTRLATVGIPRCDTNPPPTPGPGPGPVPTPTPTPTPPPPTPTPTPNPPPAGSYTYALRETVPVRSGPATTYPTIAVWAGGTEVTFSCYVLGTTVVGDNSWVPVKYGYLSGSYFNTGGWTLAQLGVPQCGTTGGTSPSPSVSVLATATTASSWTGKIKQTVSVRMQPATASGTYGVVFGGSLQTFDCYWGKGQAIGGNQVWGHLKDGRGWVADYYINGGGRTLAQLGLPVCKMYNMVTRKVDPSVPIRVLASENSAANGNTGNEGMMTFDCYLEGNVVGTSALWGHLLDGRGYVPQAKLSTSEPFVGFDKSGLPKCNIPFVRTYSVTQAWRLRSGPNSGTGMNSGVAAGELLDFDCYMKGGIVNGDSIWGHSAARGGFVPDAYIKLGGRTLEQVGLPYCELNGQFIFQVPTGATVWSNQYSTGTAVSSIPSGAWESFICHLSGRDEGGNVGWLFLANRSGVVSMSKLFGNAAGSGILECSV